MVESAPCSWYESRSYLVWTGLAKAGTTLRKRRPAVVVQNDVGNRHSPHAIVAAVRHDAGKLLPVHVPLPAGTAGLPKDSVVDAGILMTLPVAALESSGRRLDDAAMRRVDQALAVSLSLGR